MNKNFGGGVKTGMTRFTLILLAIMLLGCKTTNNEKREIERVFQEKEKAKLVLNRPKQKQNARWSPKTSEMEYFELLKKISIEKCPGNFRVAWVGYLQAWDQDINRDPLELLRGSKFIIEELTNQRKADAWREVQKVSAFYGVDIVSEIGKTRR